MAGLILKNLINSLNYKEKIILKLLFFILIISSLTRLIFYIYDHSEIISIQGGTFKEGFIGQPIYINPIISQNEIDLVLSSLIYSKMKDLIETYETENNFKTHIIVLKENIFWSDNNPITTDDIIFTLNLIKNSELNHYLNEDFKNLKYEQISKIKIKFNLNESSLVFKEKILNLKILPNHIFNKIPFQNIKLSNYNLKPLSSGPYSFKNIKKRKNGFIEEYNLKINENYFLNKPYIKNISFKFFENETELIQALKIKEIDAFFINPTNFSLSNLLNSNNKNYEIKVIKSPLNYVIIFNPSNNPDLNNPDLRLALNQAIDKNILIDNLFKNNIKFNKFNKIDFQSDFVLEYNLEKAQEKIKNLKEINLTFILNKNDVISLKIFENLKKEWLKLNFLINAELILLNEEEFQERIKNKNFEALIIPIELTENNIYKIWHSNFKNNSIINYENKKMDQYLNLLKIEKNEENKKVILNQIKNIIHQENYFIFLFKIPYYYIYNKKIKNINIEKINNPEERFMNINDWYILKARKLK